MFTRCLFSLLQRPGCRRFASLSIINSGKHNTGVFTMVSIPARLTDICSLTLPSQVTSNAPFKPSPLSFASPRASPFRRPSTSNSPPAAQTGRPSTPGSSPGRGYTPVVSPSKLNQSYTAADEDGSPKGRDPIPQPRFTREVSPSPTRGAASPDRPTSSVTGLRTQGMTGGRSSDAASRLSPAQLREIREAFQVLDRDNDGSVDRDDVADVLSNVGEYDRILFAASFSVCHGTGTDGYRGIRSGPIFALPVLPPGLAPDDQFPDVPEYTLYVAGSAFVATGARQCLGGVR